jgi:isoprenylcysteine carboxyl methyltransferase (ICMT) family protein YpbQ
MSRGEVSTTGAAEVLRRLRRFLLVLALFLFGGAVVELWLVGHTQDWIQLIAFALAGTGALAVLLVVFRQSSATVRILRVCMVVVVLGSLFGMYEHLNGNIAFAREIQPNLATAQLFWRGLQGGNPLLAPGLLAVAALLAISATYRYDVTT